MYTISCRILTPFCICCFSVVGPPPVFKTFVHNVVTVVRLSTRSSPSHLVISSKSSPVSPLRYSHLSEACSLKAKLSGKTQLTHSQTHSLTIQPSTSISSLPISNSSCNEVNNLFDTSTLTPLPSPMSENNNRDAPPHINPPAPKGPPPPPVIDPNLQQAMTALFQAMTANMPATPPPPAPAAQGHEGPMHQCVKAQEPDPYDGSDPPKLHAFLSQCKLVFRSSTQAFANNELKIMYAVSYLKGTTLQWFELNLSLNKFNLPHYAYAWNTFKEELKLTFSEPDPIASGCLVSKDARNAIW